MSWLRFGDNGFFNPIVLRARALLRSCTETVLERDVITCELLGFAIACASLTAGFNGDYIIGYGTAFQVAGSRTDRLLELAEKAGYMAELPYPVGGEPVWKMIDDPQFIHMIPRDAQEWMAQRKKDVANPALTVPVRLRDGDACRYCGVVVNWNDRKSRRGATYDHRPPGQPGTVQTMVVCCFGCNRDRGDDLSADQRVPLMPPPDPPYYSPATLQSFAEHPSLVPRETQTRLNLQSATRPARAMTDEPSDPAASRAARPATPRPAGQRTSTDHGSVAPVSGARSADPADPRYPGSGFTGSGRDGSGRVPAGSRSGTSGSADPGRRRSRRRKPR